MAGSHQESVTYDDRIAAYFLAASFVWGIIGMILGVYAALELVFWPANGGVAFLSFGRLRPLHTHAMIFAFAGNAFFAGLYYSLQRLCKTRMWSGLLSKMHFWGWQIMIVLSVVTLALGYSQNREYAEMEWPIDLFIGLVWILLSWNFFATLAVRKVKSLYISLWFYIATILALGLLHLVNGLSRPVAFLKSYPLYAGVQDALVQSWFGQNLLGFLLGIAFIGLLYYFVPKAVNKPVYSYRLAVLHFWSLIFLTTGTGPGQLLYTAVPEWMQSLGMVFSFILIAPSWGAVVNGVFTLSEAWSKVRKEPVLKFFLLAFFFYGLTTLESSLLSIKSINIFLQNTDWISAHNHSSAMGWLSSAIFGMAYVMVPRLWGQPLYSRTLVRTHFWLSLLGVLLYLSALYASGVTQSLRWFATNEDGLLKFPQFLSILISLKVFYWTRMVGGIFFLVGTSLCAFNLLKTAQSGQLQDETAPLPDDPQTAAITLQEKMEVRPLSLSLVILLALLIGGLVEFLPGTLVGRDDPILARVKPYSPLELQGRDIYMREGCSGCHSQQVRSYHKEELRYGPASQAYEFIHDRPTLWSGKRKGPDLHRSSQKYPSLWHYKHLLDPRSTSPDSNMPAYPWLLEKRVDPASVVAKIQAMQGLGVPYDAKTLLDPWAIYLTEAQRFSESFAKDSIPVDPQSEIIALIAYLQKLGSDFQKKD